MFSRCYRLCFRYKIVRFLYFLNPKFQAFSHHLLLYSPLCVGPGRKPRRYVFSRRGSIFTYWPRPEPQISHNKYRKCRLLVSPIQMKICCLHRTVALHFRSRLYFQTRAGTAADVMDTDNVAKLNGCNDDHVQCNGTDANAFGKFSSA